MTFKDADRVLPFSHRCGLSQVYQPTHAHETPKKNPCPDCHFCQQCSETRCHACRRKGSPKRRLSFSEQIALYESLNAQHSSKKSS